jgi:hypothetical protein
VAGASKEVVLIVLFTMLMALSPFYTSDDMNENCKRIKTMCAAEIPERGIGKVANM